ncbi:ssl1498 family light-harvesting-like protein [Anabaena sphaerica FACHB-251]|uniref:Ssl1498 family light-harvesting-like protein n=1 Tax=Anabaena sphaerica FACHB-251 TaxID=2692883 RepID=A0A926WFV6_9NOST|nr:ssl1498 family light-harvesting-like protein [Anabaena sphaerica]MBD2292721.1 ssl1498 family light-harvesting-like protein [Anabaena sphaerica FACHB-251]
MYTTTDEKGILNNYATEPQLYYAQYPTQEQQNRYLFQGAVAILFVASIFLIALGVS